jgi:hypothetical protein
MTGLPTGPSVSASRKIVRTPSASRKTAAVIWAFRCCTSLARNAAKRPKRTATEGEERPGDADATGEKWPRRGQVRQPYDPERDQIEDDKGDEDDPHRAATQPQIDHPTFLRWRPSAARIPAWSAGPGRVALLLQLDLAVDHDRRDSIVPQRLASKHRLDHVFEHGQDRLAVEPAAARVLPFPSYCW